MTDRWRRVESLCHAALARPAGERAAFLAEACGDDESLRAEVESLIAGADSAPSFLETAVASASRPSLVGRQLGAYRIEAPIGAGGMGEVYRAKDTRLGRDVAVKILPAVFAADARRRTRFEREARAVAALNHPNICTIHDVGHDQGIDFLVMELVDGESLAARLARGPLPLDEALARAIEIADALDKAHGQGIIHRDLKPGNVMLARAGSGKSRATQAKLLDFGLARIMPSRAGAGRLAQGDTSAMTEPGAMLGTLQYMAPEQIEGRPADARTDIFAFGALLYEMMTGRRAFDGASTAAVMAAILREEAPPLESVTPGAPGALGRLVRNCLAKDPDDRYTSVHDVLLELRGLADGHAGGGSVPPPTRWWHRAVVGWAVATLSLATAGVLLLRQPDSTLDPTSVPRMRATILPPPGLEIDPVAGIALSPDGTRLVYRAGNTLWVRASDELAARELPGSAGAYYPFWSHDSRSIGFFIGNRLFRMRPDDGAPTFVCEVQSPRGGSWSVNDVILLGTRDVLRSVAASGGPIAEVSRLEPQHFAHKWPAFLPDGRHFLYTAQLREWKKAPLELFLGSLDGTPPRRLGDTWSGAVHAPPGFVLSVGFPGRTLVARRLDLAAGRLAGDAIAITAGQVLISQRWNALFAASSAGSLVYLTGADTPLRRLTWTNSAGAAIDVASPARFSELALSPDGRRVAATISDDDRATTDLWEIDLDNSRPPIRLTDTLDDEQLPIWTRTPNGQDIFYAARRRGSVVDIYRRRPGDATETLVRALEGEGSPCDVSRDGKWLLYREQRTGEPAANLWLLPLAGGDPAPFQVDGYMKDCGRISPDGRWVLFTSAQSGQHEVYVRGFPEGRAYPVSRGRFPRWDPTGAAIYYFDEPAIRAGLYQAGGRVLSMTLAPGPTPVFGAPRVVFEDGGFPHGFAVAPGPRFLRLLDDSTAPAPSLTLLTRWVPDGLP